MTVHQVEAFQVDEGSAVVGCAGGIQYSNNRESEVVPMSAGITMGGIEFVADTDLVVLRNTRPHDGLEVAILIGMVLNRSSIQESQFLFEQRPEPHFFKEIRCCANDTVLSKVVSQR